MQEENLKTFPELKLLTQQDLMNQANKASTVNEYKPIAAAMIYQSLGRLDKNATKDDISYELKKIEILHQDTDNSRIIDEFAGKIKNRMTNGQTPQQAFEDIMEYDPGRFWQFINWCAWILSIHTEKSLKDRISSISSIGLRIARIAEERQERLRLQEQQRIAEQLRQEQEQLRLQEQQRQEQERIAEQQRQEQERIASIKIQSLYRSYISRKKSPLPKDLFRTCLLRDKRDFQDIGGAQRINGSIHAISKKSNQDGEWYCKESHSGEVSAAAMMQFYLGADKTTEYVLIKDSNQKNLVASLSVRGTTMTLNQYIEQYIKNKKEADLDKKEFISFKEKFAQDYILPTLTVQNGCGKDIYLDPFLLIKLGQSNNLMQIQNIINDEDNLKYIQEIYLKIQKFDKYKSFVIEKIIQNIESNSHIRKASQNNSTALIEDIIAMNIEELAIEGNLTEQNKEKIREYCNTNWNFVSLNLNSRSRDYKMWGPIMIDALGGVNSPILKDYIRLQLANFKVDNYDGHNNNIIVTLDKHEKATGLVPIDFGSGYSRKGEANFRDVKECLNVCKPGLVKAITDEFEVECSQTRKLHDLAKLLGAKEEEYQHLLNKDLTAADFQKYVTKALAYQTQTQTL